MVGLKSQPSFLVPGFFNVPSPNWKSTSINHSLIDQTLFLICVNSSSPVFENERQPIHLLLGDRGSIPHLETCLVIIIYFIFLCCTFHSSLPMHLFIFFILFGSIFLDTMASNGNHTTLQEGQSPLQLPKAEQRDCHYKPGEEYGTVLFTSTDRNFIEFDEGWEFLQKGITKMKRIVEGMPETQFSSDDYMKLYTTVYKLCTQDPLNDYSQQLYDKYRETFEVYITSTVLPSLREKPEESMLQELVKRWTNHKVMARWLSRFFHFLDRYFIARRSLPSLNEVALISFRDLVYHEVNANARVAVIDLICKEREGEQIDRELVKNVVDMFVEIGNGKMDAYEKDLEAHMLENTGDYYSLKASSWILEYSSPDYMLKVDECLRMERERVSHYP